MQQTKARNHRFQSTLPQRERLRWSDKNDRYEYFNPRSREGSDGCEACVARASGKFQSTLPRRERLSPFFPTPVAITISIHAPAKGATMKLSIMAADKEISIHAPAKGATIYTVCNKRICCKFQSTLPRRERRCMQTPEQEPMNFNPRSREGSDIKNINIIL